MDTAVRVPEHVTDQAALMVILMHTMTPLYIHVIALAHATARTLVHATLYFSLEVWVEIATRLWAGAPSQAQDMPPLCLLASPPVTVGSPHHTVPLAVVVAAAAAFRCRFMEHLTLNLPSLWEFLDHPTKGVPCQWLYRSAPHITVVERRLCPMDRVLTWVRP